MGANFKEVLVSWVYVLFAEVPDCSYEGSHLLAKGGPGLWAVRWVGDGWWVASDAICDV